MYLLVVFEGALCPVVMSKAVRSTASTIVNTSATMKTISFVVRIGLLALIEVNLSENNDAYVTVLS